MEYRRIVAVTGLPGLFEIVSSKTDGAIIRSLEDKSTRFVSSRIHNLSHLESIEVYTVHDNVNLAEILNAMQASKEPLPDGKDNKVLKAYFEKVYPDLVLTLKSPIEATLFMGIKKKYQRVAIRVDDPHAFKKIVKERLEKA